MHWATGINKPAVTMTCWNLLETRDVLDYEGLLPLLLEEYEQEEIDRFRPHIDECMAHVNAELSFRARVMAEYRALGLSIEQDKGAVMRALSKRFKKDEMGKVFAAIALSKKG